MNNFDPLKHGLYRSLIDNSGLYINVAAWGRAQGGGEFVGTCRVCGDQLVALATHTAGKTNWFAARCVNQECLHEIAMPNGAVLKRSGLHSEMPEGFWAKKTGAQ